MRTAILALMLGNFLVGTSVSAAPVVYLLEPDRSTVGFEVDWGQEVVRGTMGVKEAALVIDFDRVANSSVQVVIEVPGARSNNPFATQTMLGDSVLNAAQFPTIAFTSASVRKDGAGAAIQGMVTIRGISQPLTLSAQIYRQAGTEAGDRTRLSILLTGAVRRSDFGATGWSDVVGDEVRLKILARITRKD